MWEALIAKNNTMSTPKMLFGTYTAVNRLHTGVSWLTRESVGDQPRNELKDAQLGEQTQYAKHQGEIDDEPLVSGNSPVKERNAVPQVLQTLATALVRVTHRHEGATSAASTDTIPLPLLFPPPKS